VRGRSVAVPIGKDEGPDAVCEGYAVTVKGLGHLGGLAHGGAQAVKGPLHADRCVQQYGLLVEANGPRGGRERWGLGPLVGSLIELGVSLRGRMPVTAGVRLGTEG